MLGVRTLLYNYVIVKIFRIIPPPATAILLVAIAYIFNILFPGAVIFQSYIIFVMVLLVGVVFVGWSVLLFRRAHTTLNPNKKPGKMIESGPYLISRNPMYLGLLLMLLGYAFLKGEFVFFVTPVVYYVLMDKIVIPYEEKMIVDAIGQEKYGVFAQKIRRWL